MPSNIWVQPAAGFGFARDICLASFASTVSGTSGFGYLATGSYEPGDVFTFDGSVLNPLFISPSSDPAPAPNIFGDWVYNILSGALPIAQSAGGIEFLGGALGGVSWIPVAFSGIHGLQIQAEFGGILGFDSALPTLSYTCNGSEEFQVEFQVLDIIPQQIFVQFFNTVDNTWHGAYLGTNFTSFSLTSKGAIPPSIGTWQTLSFTAAEIGLTVGAKITGMSWGVWNQLTGSSVVFSDTAVLNPFVPGSSIPSGYVDCVQDGNIGFYILSHFGPLLHIPVAGTLPTTILLPVLPSFDYTGITYNSIDTNPYFIGYDGTIYNVSGTSVNTITAPPVGVSPPARWLYTDNANNLYSMFPTDLETATYELGSATWVTTGTPFTASLDTIYYSNDINTLIAGGTNYQVLNIGPTIIDMAYSTATNQLLLVEGTPNIAIYNLTGGGFSFAQNVSGISGAPAHIATEPDGLQALQTDTANNLVNILTNIGGTWNKTSSVSLTAPTSLVTVTSGITQALICQPTNNTVSILNKSALTWGVSQTLSIPDSTSIAVTSDGTNLSAMVSTATGVTFLTFNGVVWLVGSSITLSPVPTLVSTDSLPVNNGLFYAAAQNGSNTTIYIFQNQSLLSQYTILGDIPGVLATINWEILLASAAGNLNTGYYIGGITNNSVQLNQVPTNPIKMLWLSSVTDYLPMLLVANNHTIWSLFDDSPQTFSRVIDSQVAIHSGASWVSIDVQNRNKLSSITTDSSGNIYAVAVDNSLYKWSSGGILASGYPFTIVPPTNQESGIPLGLSKLLYWRNNLYSASSLAGGIVIIST